MQSKREAEVWERVLAASAAYPISEKQPEKPGLTAEQVLQLLQQELLNAVTYETLAARVGKRNRQRLLALAREERQHARQLEAVYYVLTGQRPCPDRVKGPCVACTNEALRSAYGREVAGADRYQKLAGQAGSFSAVFQRLSCAEQRHSAAVLQLLQACL